MKKLVSIIMTITTALCTANLNIFAMQSNELEREDYRKIRSYFNEKSESEPDEHKAINFKLRESYSSGSDYREVSVCNIQHLIGMADGDDFLQAVLSLYVSTEIDVREACSESDLDEKLESVISRAISKVSKRIDSSKDEKEKIHILSRKLGLSYDDALCSYLMFVSERVILSDYDYMKELLDKNMRSALFYLIEPLLGEKNAAIISLGIRGSFTEKRLSRLKYYVVDDYLQKQLDDTNVIFRIQRIQNISSVMKQIRMQVINEPRSTVNSNVFLLAVDARRNADGSNFEENWGLWKWWNSGLRDDESYCRFKRINNLKGAPKICNYISRDGRSIEELIMVFSGTLIGKITEYKILKEYIDKPYKFKITFKVTAPSAKQIEDGKEKAESDTDREVKDNEADD